VFIHSGGTNTVGRLVVGCGWESRATYELMGAGHLVAGEELVVHCGGGEASSFLQDGGTNTVDRLKIGWENPEGPGSPPDRYVLTGGTLEVLAGLILAGGGELHLDGCSLDLTWENVVADFSGGRVVGAGNASLTVLGTDSLVILSPGQEPNNWFGSFSNAGWTHVAGSPLVVPDANNHAWAGEIQEHVVCEGTITAAPGKGLDLTGGLELRSGASVDLGKGKLVVRDRDSNMIGGSQLTANKEFIGYPNGGTFTQTGGTHALNVLVLGSHWWYWGEEATFNLAGGTLTVGTLLIGGEEEDILAAESEEFIYATFNLCGGVLEVGELRMGYVECTWGSPPTNAFHFTGGTLKAGFMNFDLDQYGGVLAPGRSVGTTTIDGSYAQYAGALAIELGGSDNSDANHPQYDVLDVAGAVYLAGSLELNWLPVPGDANSRFGGDYDVVVYGGVLFGEFADLGGNIDPVYIADIDYDCDLGDGNSAVRITLHDLLDGDADLDGLVGRSDFHALQEGFGSADPNWFDGDFNFDGRVDFRDYLTWKANVGDSVASGKAPDPATFALLAIGGSLALLRRRRR
ncbi:MAG: PEP-CTERM sorting domain-containing protein, partial [Phycisphaerae bacterium]